MDIDRIEPEVKEIRESLWESLDDLQKEVINAFLTPRRDVFHEE